MSDSTTSQCTPAQVEDWKSIFGAFPDYWSWWHGIKHLDGGDWDRPSKVELTIDDPDEPDGSKAIRRILEPKEIFTALATATEKHPWLFGRNERYGELELDAGSSDIVLQVALFGEAVYG